eukprot:jgi/Chrzof1/9087/Cz03g35180.t1
MSSPLIGGALETGINYTVYSRVLQSLKAPSDAGADPPLPAVALAGATGGVALSVVLAPTELVKCRMQLGHYTSPLHCLRHLLHQEGPLGLLRGFGATLTREIPGNTIFFTVYEALRRTLPGRPSNHHSSKDSSNTNKGSHSSSSSSSICCSSSSTDMVSAVDQAQGHPYNTSSTSSSSSTDISQSSSSHRRGSYFSIMDIIKDAGSAILCGGMAGTVMWATVLPLDVAKTRIQTAQPNTLWDTNVLRHLKMLWQEGGVRSLWAGLTPTLIRAFPANACQWLAWEAAMRYLDETNED